MSDAVPVRQRLFRALAHVQAVLRGEAGPTWWTGTDTPTWEPVYETKVIRTHEPDLGRYVYVMVTRFDGDRSILGDIGFRSVYFQFDVMSQNKGFRTGNASAYALLDDLPEWFRDSAAFALIYALDSTDGPELWSRLSDGTELTPADVERLTGREVAGAGHV